MAFDLVVEEPMATSFCACRVWGISALNNRVQESAQRVFVKGAITIE
jgi:hypothetical protein